ncbi:ComEC/Rec2 family competence protein [Clostridium guangxiense]|uniref:ComEC/Rec2 family competence protein n=2 Tax=Clostridium TaxID=1485 RepID=UPI001E353D26|nr:ComEC/Rec2 family competence protein [Clostridium guangxiense]MCD2347538.1 ComEC/Rec2 family competence protein [Clostridium guangxiense]
MSNPLVFYCISTIIGILSYIILNYSIVLGAVIAASFFGILYFNIDKKFCALCILFVCLGFVSSNLYFNVKIPKQAALEIRINSKNNYYAEGSCLGRNFNLKGNLNKVSVGDLVKIYGEFSKDIDYDNGIIGDLNVKEVKYVKKDFISQIYDFRRKIFEKYKGEMGKDDAGIVMSLCFGDTSNLSSEYKNNLKTLGIIHAISVSGMHIGVIYIVMEKLLGTFGALIVSLIYVIFTGNLPATVRSFIMIAILKLSYRIHKNYNALVSLAFSALVMLVLKPYYLLNIGFDLSYLATLGIIIFYKKIRRMMYKLPQKLNDALSVTLSAQIFSVPYCLLVLNSFSGGFILGNLIVVPVYSLIVLLGNAGIFLFQFDYLFSLLCKGIDIILKSLDGVIDDLLFITPHITYATSFIGVALIFILVSFAMYLKGNKKLKYFPVIIFIAVTFQSYCVFPKISYVTLKNSSALIVNYKNRSVAVMNGYTKNEKDKKEIANRFSVNGFVYNYKTFIINKVYRISVDSLKNNVEIYCNGKKMLQSDSNNIVYKRSYLNGYDIIKMDKTQKYDSYKIKASALIIFGKILVLRGE